MDPEQADSLVPSLAHVNVAALAADTGLSVATVIRAIKGKPGVAERTRARVLAALHSVSAPPARAPAGSMLRPRRVNIHDIATRTGLSTSTVSRAINGEYGVADQTRARVLDVLDELGYVPGGLAAGLRTGHTHLLGLMIGEQHDPTALATMQGALEAATAASYGVVVYMTRDPREREPLYSQALAHGWVDGAMVLYPSRTDEPFVRRLYQSGMPLVLIEPEAEMSGIPSVYADAYTDGYRSTRHLLELGHRRIGLCADVPGFGIEYRYLEGYRAALTEVGVPFDPALALAAGWTYQTGQAVALGWLHLPDPPTAMCFCSDIAATGAVVAAHGLGLRVPEDLSVVGYDDTQMAGWLEPTLTTPRARRFGLAQVACEVLLALLDGKAAPTTPLLVQTELILRQSTGPVRHP